MLIRQKKIIALNKTQNCFAKDLKHHRVKFTSELGGADTKHHWVLGWRYCMQILTSKDVPFMPKKPSTNSLLFFPALKKPQFNRRDWARCETSAMHKLLAAFCPVVNFLRILYIENVNWLSLANGHTEPYSGCRKEKSTSLSIKQDYIDSQHKTVFFSVVCIIITSCLHIEQLLHYCSTYKNIVRNL